MAIATNSELLFSDVQDWYNRLNTIIGNHGGGIAQLPEPIVGKTIELSDINNIIYKINEIKTDSYLGYDTSLYASYAAISSGDIVSATGGTPLTTTVANLEKIKCRNDATKSNGNSNTKKSNTNTYGVNSNTWSQGTNNHGYSQSIKSNGNNHGINYNTDTNWINTWGNAQSTNKHGNSVSVNGHGDSKAANSYGKKTVDSKFNGDQCSFWAISGTKTNGNSISIKSNGNAIGTKSNENTNTKKANGYGNASKSHEWNQGAPNSNTCGQTPKSHGNSVTIHGHEDNNTPYSNATQRDIFHVRTKI